MTRFLAVWAGQLASLLGSGLTAFALSVWVYQRTAAVTDLTLIAVAAYLPHVLVAPYGGVLADRFDRRIVMLVADTGSAAATLLLLAFAAAGRLEPVSAAALVAAGACCNAVQWPAYEAAIVTLVPRAQLGRANGLCELSRGTSQLLAPILAGALYGSLGLRGILIIDLASFVVGIAPLLALQFPPHTRDARSVRGWLADLGTAWNLVARRPGLVAMLALFSITNFTFAVAELSFKPLVLAAWSAWELGALLSTVGAGMVAGALAMAAWGGPRRTVLAIFVFQLVEGGSLVVAGASTFPALWAAAFAYGLVIPLTFGCARMIWQVKVPLELQGRVTALRNALVMLAIPIGYGAASLLSSWLDPRDMIVAMGIVTCAAAAGVFAFAPYRRLEQDLDDLLVSCLDGIR